ncbi:MAG TPA: DUF2905 family protein [Pyrinomonadaceae bacterium]|nr:DUF2905 family protein [Pyrinomonadaceae bacterium]
MFISSGLFILLALIFLTIIGFLIFSRRRLTRFGQLPGDIRYEGRRTRVYAPLASMLLLSLVLSLAVYLLGAIF